MKTAENMMSQVEERQMRAAYNATYLAEDGMSSKIREVYATLGMDEQKQAMLLWKTLKELRIKPGIANSLMGMAHMGRLNDPIWKYIYMLKHEPVCKRVIKKGEWLLKCMRNGRYTTPCR